MKKTLIIVLFAVLVLFITACDPVVTTPPVPTSPVPALSTPTVTPPKLRVEGKIIFSISESNDVFSLSLWTEENYSDYGNLIKLNSSIDNSQSIKIEILYVYNPTWPTGLPMVGPAGYRVDLGKISGEYNLSFAYNDMLDNYRVTFAPDKISVSLINSQFTLPLHEIWLRLPPDTIWFNTQSVEVGNNKPTGYKNLNKPEYQFYVDNFFAQVEALGAKQFIPEEGYYPYYGFIPPWPDKFIIRGDYTEILSPDNSNALWSMKWPDIRFYRYSGELENITNLINTEYPQRSSQLWLEFYNIEKRLYPDH